MTRGRLLLYHQSTIPMRIAMFMVGLACFGLAMVMSLQSNLGANSWMVLHDGMTKQTPLTLGMASMAVSTLFLIAAWLLGFKPTLGTLSAIFITAFFYDVFLAVVPKMEAYPARAAMLIGSIVLLGFATALYIKAGFGAGARDALMLVLTLRTKIRVGVVRWAIEITMVIIGVLLGGAFGIGTIIFAFLIGLSVDFFLGLFRIKTRETSQSVTGAATSELRY